MDSFLSVLPSPLFVITKIKYSHKKVYQFSESPKKASKTYSGEKPFNTILIK